MVLTPIWQFWKARHEDQVLQGLRLQSWPWWRPPGVSPPCTELTHQRTIPASTRGKDFQLKLPNMHRRCPILPNFKLIAVVLLLFLNFAIPWAHPHPPGAGAAPRAPHSSSRLRVPTKAGAAPGHSSPLSALPFIPQITRSSESWVYSPGFLQMGRVSSNEGEVGIFLHQTAITEHAAFWRLKGFLKNNEYTWACAFRWVLKLKESELALFPQGR